jgi:hypothetical protein
MEKEVVESPTARIPNHREHGKDILLHYSVCFPETLSGQSGKASWIWSIPEHCNLLSAQIEIQFNYTL